METFETDFLDACRRERARSEREVRQSRRLRWLAIGATVVALIAVSAAAWAWIERGNAERAKATAINAEATAVAEAERADRQAQIAFARQLLAQADPVYEEDPLLGLWLALEAGEHFTETHVAIRSQIHDSILDFQNNGRVAKLSNSAQELQDVPDTPWMLIQDWGTETQYELRSKADGELVTSLTGSVLRINVVDEAFPFFVVDYSGDTPSELRSKADGELATGLTKLVSWVDTVNESFPFFAVSFNGDKPSELRRKADGELVVSSILSVADNPDFSRDFFLLHRTNRHSELWQVSPTRRIADFDIGLPWSSGKPSTDSIQLNNEEQTLAIRYEDGRAYLLNLAWLVDGRDQALSEDPLFTESMVACEPFVTHSLDKSILQQTELLAQRPTRACPEHTLEVIRLMKAGRAAAQQLDVNTSISYFADALVRDPDLPLIQSKRQGVLPAGPWPAKVDSYLKPRSWTMHRSNLPRPETRIRPTAIGVIHSGRFRQLPPKNTEMLTVLTAKLLVMSDGEKTFFNMFSCRQ